jgi:hypothetical protein
MRNMINNQVFSAFADMLSKIKNVTPENEKHYQKLAEFKIIFNIEPYEEIKKMDIYQLESINEYGLKGFSLQECIILLRG